MARLCYNGLATGASGSTVGLSLGVSLTSSATSVTFNAALTHSNGTAVPTITGSDYIPLEILDTNGRLSEIVYLTAYTAAGTTGTISRGKEGTTGVAHSSGDKIVHGATVMDATELWTPRVNDVLSSTSALTVVAGTWSTSAGVVVQTGTGASEGRALYQSMPQGAYGCSSVDLRYDSGSGTQRVGMHILCPPSSGNSGTVVYLQKNGSNFDLIVESVGAASINTVSTVTFAASTWSTLSVVHSVGGIEVFLDGTFICLAANTPDRAANSPYVGLYTFGAAASFRNLKTWRPTYPF